MFERILAEIDPYYESKGIYILSVEGIGFKEYIRILSALNIVYVLRTDNDISKIPNSKPAQYKQAGFERINALVKHINNVITTDVLAVNHKLIKRATTPHYKRNYYDGNKIILDNLRNKYKLYLSHCDLEEDLCKCLGNKRFCELLECTTATEAVKRLKSKKQHIMVELTGKLSKADCQKIYNHYNFACLKAVRNETF